MELSDVSVGEHGFGVEQLKKLELCLDHDRSWHLFSLMAEHVSFVDVVSIGMEQFQVDVLSRSSVSDLVASAIFDHINLTGNI